MREGGNEEFRNSTRLFSQFFQFFYLSVPSASDSTAGSRIPALADFSREDANVSLTSALKEYC